MHDTDKLTRFLSDARRAGFKIMLGVEAELLLTRGDVPGVSIPSRCAPTRLDTGEPLDGLDGAREFLGLDCQE